MPFLKQSLLWLFFAVSVYLGGSGIQSASTAGQGFGFVAVVLGLVCLYVLFKQMSGATSPLSVFLISGCVILYLGYCVGVFNKNYLSTAAEKSVEITDTDSLAEAMFGEDDVLNAQDQTAENDAAKSAGLWDGIKNLFAGKGQMNVAKSGIGSINPLDYPAIFGIPRVISGSVLLVNGLYVKLLGIEAPDPRQTCANRNGAGYYCGHEAITWLQNWLNNRPVKCHILGDVSNGWTTGVCFVDDGKYDVAAVVTNAGWAVAYTKNTDIYVAYEQQASANHRGLWQGTFYKPWDWHKMQNRKVDIKIKYNKPKKTASAPKKKKSGFSFKDLFK